MSLNATTILFISYIVLYTILRVPFFRFFATHSSLFLTRDLSHLFAHFRIDLFINWFLFFKFFKHVYSFSRFIPLENEWQKPTEKKKITERRGNESSTFRVFVVCICIIYMWMCFLQVFYSFIRFALLLLLLFSWFATYSMHAVYHFLVFTECISMSHHPIHARRVYYGLNVCVCVCERKVVQIKFLISNFKTRFSCFSMKKKWRRKDKNWIYLWCDAWGFSRWQISMSVSWTELN